MVKHQLTFLRNVSQPCTKVKKVIHPIFEHIYFIPFQMCGTSGPANTEPRRSAVDRRKTRTIETKCSCRRGTSRAGVSFMKMSWHSEYKSLYQKLEFLHQKFVASWSQSTKHPRWKTLFCLYNNNPTNRIVRQLLHVILLNKCTHQYFRREEAATKPKRRRQSGDSLLDKVPRGRPIVQDLPQQDVQE